MRSRARYLRGWPSWAHTAHWLKTLPAPCTPATGLQRADLATICPLTSRSRDSVEQRTNRRVGQQPTAVREDKAVAVQFDEAVGYHGLGAGSFASAQHRRRQAVTQSQPQHHVLDVPGVRVQLLE